MRVEETGEFRNWVDGLLGDKSTQQKDIAKAIRLAKNFQE